jgi:thioredoxin reductase
LQREEKIMSLITSLVKRRQFLLGAVGSTCALTCKKLAAFAVANGAVPTSGSAAMEAQAASAAAASAAINKCPHLLSPLRIRNVILKNRIMHTQAPPHSMQGPENYPADAFRNHYSDMAKNAAIVSFDTHFAPSYPIDYSGANSPMSGMLHYSDHIWEDIPPVHNYVNRMIDDMHIEGALVRYAGNLGTSAGSSRYNGMNDQGSGPSGGGQAAAPGGSVGAPQAAAGGPGGAQQAPGGAAGAGGGVPGRAGGGPGGGPQAQKPDTRTVKDIVADAKEVEAMGYDVYDLSTTNKEAVEAVRNSTNLILLTHLGEMYSPTREDTTPPHPWDDGFGGQLWQSAKRTPGITNDNRPTKDDLDQAIEQARKLEGLVDIFWIRDRRCEHPNSFIQDPDKPFNLYYAEALKKAGIKTLLCPSAGFHDAAQNDQFIASGLTDMVGMSTPFFADPEFVKKAAEGRLDDILPCIQCHNCHGVSRSDGPWYDVCTVNPKWATPAYKLQNIPAPTTKKMVAVIGGGVAGMRAAIIASERGHTVTLYERDKALGGHMQFTDSTQWKWNHRKFKDYLIHQVNKHGVEVLLNTKATPEAIKAKGYDTVLVANGAQPVFSEWESAGAANIFNLMDSYTNKSALGKNIVVIGEGFYSTEAAIGMAKDGHKVTILCPTKDLIERAYIGPHNMMDQIQILECHPNINFELDAKVTSIKGDTVTYADSKGAEKTLQADSFVIWSGMKPRVDEAEKYIGTAAQVLFIGDCTTKGGTVQKTQRQAFFIASQV